MEKNNSHPLDIYIGQRLRLRRKMMGMSQVALGQEVAVTFQQIQKYERGTNSISARRLHEFATVLAVPVTHFYEGYGEGIALVELPPASAQVQHLVRDFIALPEKLQNNIASFVRDLAKSMAPKVSKKKVA